MGLLVVHGHFPGHGDLRIRADDGMECWDALLELRACTGEVILFFLNGETYLGPSCCRSIRTIEHQCWPSMLFTLGFTYEEGDTLRGYCDAFDFLPPPPPPPYLGAATGAYLSHGTIGAP
ncbi:hypothetical protein MRB53_021815 [Persea americana]|uniref:Uncharacterized protein n=1 Tax=Persea americana TaxID=3435 RepID=A0ACC2L5E7_PERAE|nr:hypothetical protein MRB53_021815 [Persea americana]